MWPGRSDEPGRHSKSVGLMESRNELTEFCPPNLQNRKPQSELHEMSSNMLQSQLICYNLLLKVHQIIPTSVLQKNKNFRYQAKAGKGKSVFPGRSAQQSFKREGTAQRSNSSKKKHFWLKRFPFRIPSVDKWYPFYILTLELHIPINWCQMRLSFKYE